MEESMKDRE